MTNKRRSDRFNALERIEQRLGTYNQAARYAERIERLGQVMFGDLWRPKESEMPPENHPDEQSEK